MDDNNTFIASTNRFIASTNSLIMLSSVMIDVSDVQFSKRGLLISVARFATYPLSRLISHCYEFKVVVSWDVTE